MKKLSILAVILTAISINTSTAQEGLSAKAGINIVRITTDFGDAFEDEFEEGFGPEISGSVSSSETGFYFGAGYNFAINESLSIEPAALISIVSDLTSLYIPVMAQYKLGESFFLQAGPQINYLLEDVEDGALGIDIAVGAGYNIDETWYIEARYGFEVSRGGDFGDFTNINTLSIGAGYRFN